MRPLEAPKKQCKPLLQRMAEDKAAQLERGSLMGSQYFMVQLPDGSYEKRLKVPVNVDPGVHSSFNLDEVSITTQNIHCKVIQCLVYISFNSWLGPTPQRISLTSTHILPPPRCQRSANLNRATRPALLPPQPMAMQHRRKINRLRIAN